MNVETLNSNYKVVSKYFTGKTVMDESLTDFQEKKSFKVLKNKTPTVKPKVKKVKQVKGQKDIRTALKAKKNDLIAYSEDFDSVCKKSGIDVDSEQLQLAIALSKSLQRAEPTDSLASSSRSLTAQQRTGLIRTTLKEYGFKVPEKPNVSRKTKKRRKPYKLLLTSDEEKQQIITDRYTQRLFELNNLKKESYDQHLVSSDFLIYNMSTNIEYEDIKDDSAFYVESLIEETPNSMGCLLKKWSDIPGRPLSPQPNESELIFSEIECSQDEFDVVLSGPLRHSKDILVKKNMSRDKGKSLDCTIVEKDVDKGDTKLKTDSIVIDNYNDNHVSPEVLFVCSDSDDNNMNNCKLPKTTPTVLNVKENNLLVVTQPSRSLSPDLFGEEEDAIVELPITTITENILKPADNVTKEESQVMDLTECVNTVSNKNGNNTKTVETVSQLSQPVDVTKRKSDDFMEMTKCVGGASQPIWGKNDRHTDLSPCEEIKTGKTRGASSTGTENVEIVNVGGLSPPKIQKFIDLTAYCENNVETNNITAIVATGDHIDLTGIDNIESEKNNSGDGDNIEHMDLTQTSSSSTDTLPFVHISGKPTVPDKSLEDTIIMNEDDYLEVKSPDIIKDINGSGSEKFNHSKEKEINAEGNILLTSPQNMSAETAIIRLDETCELRAVEDDVDLTQSSDSIAEEKETNAEGTIPPISPKNMSIETAKLSLNETCEIPSVKNDFDLTQASDSNDEEKEKNAVGTPPVAPKNMSIGTAIISLDETCEIPSVKNDFDLTQASDSNDEEKETNAVGTPPVTPKNMSKGTAIISLDETCEIPAVENDIDLTQSSDSNEASNIMTNNSSHQINNSGLGKRDNVSVDYDEALENMNSFPYYTHDENYDNATELRDKLSPNKDQTIISNDRQATLELIDNNLESLSKADIGDKHFDFGGISVIDNLPSFNSKSRNTLNGSMSDSLPMVNIKGIASPGKPKSPVEEILDPVINSVNYRNLNDDKPNNSSPQTPQNKINRGINVETPEQTEYIVKTDNVTPMLDYASMSTPERNRELDKYGLKPFKRKRAIQLLTHLYNQTHPYVESTEELTSPSKKRKTDDPCKPSSSKSSTASTISRNQLISPRKTSKSPKKQSKSPRKYAGDAENLNEPDKENDLFRMTNEVPAIRNIECDADDWVFQKREKAKLHSCRVPLHIAFHNFVSCRSRLQEAILRYEPVNIDVLHKELAASGHRYDPKDLLKFMDKKCITVKTTDNSKNK